MSIRFTWEGTRFIEKRNGFLGCEDCNDTWCKHIQEVIHAHGDAEGLLLDKTFLEDPGYREITVPIWPKEGEWLVVQLRPYGIKDVYSAHDTESPDDMPLGFIHEPYEGRRVLRNMFFAYFATQLPGAIAAVKCEHRDHGWQAQQVWEKMKKESPQKAYYFLWKYNKCYICQLGASAPLDHDDLVPNTGGWNG